MEEDPTFLTSRDSATKEILVSGLGDLHLEVISSKLLKKIRGRGQSQDPQGSL